MPRESQPQTQKTNSAQALWKSAVTELLDRNKDKAPLQSAKNKSRLRQIKKILSQSETGKMLVDWANKNKVEIWLDEQMERGFASGFVVLHSNTVVLNAAYPNDSLASTLAHEILHVWQVRQGLISSAMDDPAQYAISTRLAEAAAFACQAKVAIELRDKGIYSGIDRLKVYDRHYGPRLFNFNASKGLIPDEVAQSVFFGFAKSGLKRSYDRRIKKVIEQNIYKRKTRPTRVSRYLASNMNFDLPIDELKVAIPRQTPEYLSQYGALPNGSNFLKDALNGPDMREKTAPFFEVRKGLFTKEQWHNMKLIRRFERKLGKNKFQVKPL